MDISFDLSSCLEVGEESGTAILLNFSTPQQVANDTSQDFLGSPTFQPDQPQCVSGNDSLGTLPWYYDPDPANVIWDSTSQISLPLVLSERVPLSSVMYYNFDWDNMADLGMMPEPDIRPGTSNVPQQESSYPSADQSFSIASLERTPANTEDLSSRDDPTSIASSPNNSTQPKRIDSSPVQPCLWNGCNGTFDHVSQLRYVETLLTYISIIHLLKDT